MTKYILTQRRPQPPKVTTRKQKTYNSVPIDTPYNLVVDPQRKRGKTVEQILARRQLKLEDLMRITCCNDRVIIRRYSKSALSFCLDDKQVKFIRSCKVAQLLAMEIQVLQKQIYKLQYEPETYDPDCLP